MQLISVNKKEFLVFSIAHLFSTITSVRSNLESSNMRSYRRFQTHQQNITFRRMFHLQKAFEASLRGGSDSSLANIKSKHKTCKGTLHATGNYQKPPPQPHVKVKSSSVSSEGFSESDSVDSLKEEANKKNSAICDRLHNTSTKASFAKTAKMRYLEDGNDEDIVWIEDLANGVDKEKKQKRKDDLKKNMIGEQKQKNEEKNNFVRSSFTRNSFTRGSFKKTPTMNGTTNGKTSTPPVSNGKPSTPLLNGSRNNFVRNSTRRSTKKKIKGGSLTWEEAWFRANNRKVHYFSGDDKTNCFKDLNVLLSLVAKTDDQIEVRIRIFKFQFKN